MIRSQYPVACSPGDAADALVLATKRQGKQQHHLVHKSEDGVPMDCGWLLQPDCESMVARFLHHQPVCDQALAPSGFGVVAVDFDKRRITSAQGYRDLGLFTADEFGYPRHVGPFWLDWATVLERAFLSGAIQEVVYAWTGASARTTKVEIPAFARNKASMALRFASNARPAKAHFQGLRFTPPGWQITHLQGASRHPRLVAERAFGLLSRDGWKCAGLDLWRRCSFN